MPIDWTQKPDEETFNRYVQYLEDEWSGALAAMETADSFYWQTNDIWDEYYKRAGLTDPSRKTRPPFHSGLFPAKVNQAVNSHIAFQPIVHRVKTGGKLADEQASRLEKGMQAVLDDSFKYSSNFPTKENGKQLQLYQYTQLGVMLDKERLERPTQKLGEDKEDFQQREWEWMSQRQHWNPIKFFVPTPGEVLMEARDVSPNIAIWRRKMRAFDLHDLTVNKAEGNRTRRPRDQRYVEIFDHMAVDPYEEIEIDEWWSPRWVVMRRRGGDIFLVERNSAGLQPFAHVWAGDAISRVGRDFDPEEWVKQGMMFRVMPTIVMYEQAKVGRHVLLAKAAWAKRGYRGDPAEAAQAMQGDILSGDAEDWWVEDLPQLAPQAYQEEADLLNNIDLATFPPQAAGFRQGEADTATGEIIRSENTNRNFRSPRAMMEHLWEVGCSNAAKYVYRMSEDYYDQQFKEIGIGENKLRAQDLGNPPQFHFQVSFEQVDAVVAREELREAMELAEAGYVGDTYVYAKGRIEDIDGARKDAIKLKVRRSHPAVQAEVAAVALRELGMDEQAEQLEQQLAQMQLQQASAQAAPPQTQPLLNGNGRANV